MTSPGASSVPANSDPIITTSAPAAIAFATSPENFTPPSEITGMLFSRAALTQLEMAVICGTPAPVTTRVVQIDPGPMPTLIASTPASINSCAPSVVPTLPAFDLLHRIDHARRMTVRRIDHQAVDTRAHQFIRPLAIVTSRADRRRHA